MAMPRCVVESPWLWSVHPRHGPEGLPLWPLARRSQRHARQRCQAIDVLAALAQLRDGRDHPDRIVLVGHSLGGFAVARRRRTGAKGRRRADQLCWPGLGSPVPDIFVCQPDRLVAAMGMTTALWRAYPASGSTHRTTTSLVPPWHGKCIPMLTPLTGRCSPAAIRCRTTPLASDGHTLIFSPPPSRSGGPRVAAACPPLHPADGSHRRTAASTGNS